MKILFLNFELGYDSGQQTLVGASNKFYGGPSRWNLEHCCQAIETQFANERDYLFALKDLAQKWGLYGQKWIPVPKPWSDEDLLAECKRRGIGDALNDTLKKCIEHGESFPEWLPIGYKTPFLRIKKVAADNGIDISGCHSNVERVDAINDALDKRERAAQDIGREVLTSV